ncbi:(4Fe-4S)-binding protein [Spirochaetia bacterium]|nr:(4Fe-4S)-binding protein [Spirochaetia bacterium]
MNKMLEDKIADYVKNSGIDVIGFAPKSRFDGLDPRYNPFSIFPEGKTVILLGKRICRGSLRGVEEGTNFADYKLFGSSWLEDEFLAIACYDLTRVIENEGYEAVPIFPNPMEVQPQGIPVEEGKPAPNVHPDFNYAAVACGIAEISFNDILFTKDFGSRQRFHMVITDAELESTPILSERVCDNCGKCVKACPLNAISPTETRTVKICGKEMKVAKIDYALCDICKNGAVPNRLSKVGRADRIAAACNRACLAHLEEAKRVGNTFENQFIQRETWALDFMGRPTANK